MSNRRRTNIGNDYRQGFLRSPVWFARRDRWFREELSAEGVLKCAACHGEATKRKLELHHLDYSGVLRWGRGWQANESHADLISLHPGCHELLHRIIDRDPVYAKLRSRRAASIAALQALTRLINAKGTL